MSIINDAIKKARKGFEIKTKPTTPFPQKSEKTFQNIPKPSDIKWKIAIVASLVFIASSLGSMFLYRYMTMLNEPTMNAEELATALEEPSSDLSPIYQKSPFPTLELDSIAELNGIVYGPEDKWAIVNNKIVREGDSLLNGEVKIIARDFIKIEGYNGGEIILELE